MSPTVMIVISTIIVLGGTSLVSLYLGSKTKSSEDWAVGGRALPVYVIIGTQFATAMGGGMLVAHVGIGYKSGWAAITYGLLVLCGFAALCLIADWLRKQNFTTLPDVFKKLYGENKFLLIVVAFMSIIVPFGWISTQLIAFGKLYSAITGIPINALMIIFAIISLLYVLPAGMSSVAWTDFIFGCLMIVVSVISIFFAFHFAGGWSKVVSTIPAQNSSFPGGLFTVGAGTIALWALSIIPGTLTNQMYFQRIFAIDNIKHVKKSLIISGLCIVIADIWASSTGMAIRTMNPNLSPEMASGWFLTKVPAWFLAIYSGFLCATIMSTIDSGIQSVVVNLTKDIYKEYINKDASDKKQLSLSRWLSVVVVALGLFFAIAYPHALDWIVATYAYSASALLFPIFLGYYMKDKKFITTEGAIGSMIFGCIGCAIAQIMKTKVPYVAFGLLASLAGLLIISAMTKGKYANKESALN